MHIPHGFRFTDQEEDPSRQYRAPTCNMKLDEFEFPARQRPRRYGDLLKGGPIIGLPIDLHRVSCPAYEGLVVIDLHEAVIFVGDLLIYPTHEDACFHDSQQFLRFVTQVRHLREWVCTVNAVKRILQEAGQGPFRRVQIHGGHDVEPPSHYPEYYHDAEHVLNTYCLFLRAIAKRFLSRPLYKLDGSPLEQATLWFRGQSMDDRNRHQVFDTDAAG